MGGSLGRQNLFGNKILFWLCVLVNLYGNFDSFSVRASTQQMSTVQRTDENLENNAVTAILQINSTSGLMRCQCNVVVANSLLPQESVINCGMFVTRCPSVRTISTTILT